LPDDRKWTANKVEEIVSEGNFSQNGMRRGRGSFTLPDGAVYD